MGRKSSDSRFMHEMALWAQAVGGSLRDLRRRREMGFRPDKFDAREPDYYEAHGYAPVSYASKKMYKEPREPGSWASRKTAMAVAAIVIGATVPAFTIVSMLNPSDPEPYHGAASEYAAQRALNEAWDDPAAAGLAADDHAESYLDSQEYRDALANAQGTGQTAPEVRTETGAEQSATASAEQNSASSPEVAGPRLPEGLAAAPSAVTPPVSAPSASAPSATTPQARPAAPQPKPAAPVVRTPRVSAPVQQPANRPTRAERPAKPQRSERDERARDKAEREAKAPKSERGKTTLVDHGTQPSAPDAPEAPKAPKKSKGTTAPETPKVPEAPRAPEAPAAPDQPSVSVDPADPANNPAAEDGPVTAPEASTEPPNTDTDRATSQDDRRVTPRSIKKEPSVTTETEDGPTSR